jgi:glucose/arabinose dehydrogenase
MGMDPCPVLEEFGGIWKFDANETGQDQMADGVHFATGIRNMVAIDWNENVDELYGVQHGRDQLHEFFPDKFSKEESATLPAEEMFLIQKDDDFGWPYCYYDGQKDKKVLAPEYGGDGDSIGRCAEKKDPIAHFPAHFAPNNLQFYNGDAFPERYKNGAFIAFHGSWNRPGHKQWGYNVTFVPFDGKKPSGEWKRFATEFEGPERVESPGQAEHRPCGLAEGPKGNLYVVDSQKGRLWRISYEG